MSNKKPVKMTGFVFAVRLEAHVYALSTKPDFRQLVQTCIFFAPPFTLHLTFFTLEFQILLDLL